MQQISTGMEFLLQIRRYAVHGNVARTRTQGRGRHGCQLFINRSVSARMLVRSYFNRLRRQQSYCLMPIHCLDYPITSERNHNEIIIIYSLPASYRIQNMKRIILINNNCLLIIVTLADTTMHNRYNNKRRIDET